MLKNVFYVNCLTMLVTFISSRNDILFHTTQFIWFTILVTGVTQPLTNLTNLSVTVHIKEILAAAPAGNYKVW